MRGTLLLLKLEKKITLQLSIGMFIVLCRCFLLRLLTFHDRGSSLDEAFLSPGSLKNQFFPQIFNNVFNSIQRWKKKHETIRETCELSLLIFTFKKQKLKTHLSTDVRARLSGYSSFRYWYSWSIKFVWFFHPMKCRKFCW